MEKNDSADPASYKAPWVNDVPHRRSISDNNNSKYVWPLFLYIDQNNVSSKMQKKHNNLQYIQKYD